MSWGAVAGAVIGGVVSSKASSKAAKASEKAAGTQAGYEQQALDYLKEQEALPTQFRNSALTGLANVYGIGSEPMNQQDLINRAMNSPLYGAIMGTKDRALDDVTARASATGMLRSGNTANALGRTSQEIQQQALLTSYQDQLQGFQGFAGLPSNANTIAQQISGIGQTLGQGQVASAQARQQGTQNMIDNTLGIAGLRMQYSDIRLKKDIHKVGVRGGFNWYSWLWNDAAKELGLEGKSEGVLAHEVYDVRPECVGVSNGYCAVAYDKLVGAHHG